MGTRFIRWSAGLATGVAVILAFALVLAPSTGLGGATNALAEGSPPRPTSTDSDEDSHSNDSTNPDPAGSGFAALLQPSDQDPSRVADRDAA